jgi:hypothetical protein
MFSALNPDTMIYDIIRKILFRPVQAHTSPYRHFKNMKIAFYNQDLSQTVTGVTDVTEPRTQGGLWGPGKGPQGAQRSLKKGPRKQAALKRAVKAKEGVVCVLEKGIKEEKLIKVKGSWWPLGTPWAPRGPKMGPTQPRGAQGGQKDRTWSNWCIKERKK